MLKILSSEEKEEIEEDSIIKGNGKMKSKKLQFVLSKNTLELLNQLVDDSGATSKAESIRDAIALYGWALSYTLKGYRILAEKDGHLVEVMIPKLSTLIRKTSVFEEIVDKRLEEIIDSKLEEKRKRKKPSRKTP